MRIFEVWLKSATAEPVKVEAQHAFIRDNGTLVFRTGGFLFDKYVAAFNRETWEWFREVEP